MKHLVFVCKLCKHGLPIRDCAVCSVFGKALKYLSTILAFLVLASSAFGQELKLPEVKKAEPERGRGYIYPAKHIRDKLHYEAYLRHGYRMHHHVQAMTAPAKFDSREMGWIPPIRDQGNCGDCFGVEASDALTISFIKAGYQKADGSFAISEQHGLDCGGYPGGCNGGDGPQVYDIMKLKGFPAEKYLDAGGKSISDYPAYTARPGACRTKAGAKMWKCADWLYVTADQSDRAPTVSEVKAGIMQYGTVTFAFDAGALSGYNGQPITRFGNNIDHEITGFMGWDDNKACSDGSKGAFISRNQWGAGFGDNGYFWTAYTALPRIVEACCLTVTALPPPPAPPPNPPTPPPAPPGPVPPSPTPGKDVKVVLKSDGTWTVEGGTIVTQQQTDDLKLKLDELQKQLDAIRNFKGFKVELPKEPPLALPKDKPISYDDWLETKGVHAGAKLTEVRAFQLAQEYQRLTGITPPSMYARPYESKP